MSSIYRKGRDGYFYYQTYVVNPKNGKKDKKIFHSLSTKDRNVAIQKQIEYDNFYQKKSNTPFLKLPFKKLSFLKIALLSTLIAISFILIHEASEAEHEKNTFDKTPILIESSVTEMDSIEVKLLEPTESLDSAIIFKKSKEKNTVINKPQIPKYIIQKTELISDALRQLKINITIDGEYNIDGLKQLCTNIRKNQKDFVNIIICLYSNSTEGVLIAKGLHKRSQLVNANNEWLAMYTFNPIEGEFFDGNPSKYSNAYK